MIFKENNRFELCYVNRLLQEVDVYFDYISDIFDFIDSFDSNILYIKSCYDFKKHEYIYNILTSNRKG